MGRAVEGVPHGARVEREGFGPWFQRQRELRGISPFFVAARTKLPSERIEQIERTDLLARDGHGRATARALARAIGADPDEAVRQLTGPGASQRAPRRKLPSGLHNAVPRTVALAVLCLVIWLAAEFGLYLASGEESPDVVYRPDYVERLLTDEP